MSAKEVRKIVGRTVWDEYFKFCVEREPVSKVISYYSMLTNSPYHNKKTKDISFDEFIEQRKFPVDTAKYTDRQGNLLVDKILRYENLTEELMSTAQHLGFSLELKAKAKTGFRLDQNVTQEQAQIIYDAFSSSNKFTGYSLNNLELP